MLDNLYENIGGKIKNWAKWIFIIEAIGAIITGLVLLCTDEDLILYGLLTLVCGPIVAWVSSWILYAFGELVEDVHAIRNKEGTVFEEKVKNEAEKKRKIEGYNNEAKRKAEGYSRLKSAANQTPHTTAKRCPYCGEIVNSKKCEMCGKEINY